MLGASWVLHWEARTIGFERQVAVPETEKAGGGRQCSLPHRPKLLPAQSSWLHLNGGQMCINIYSELPGNLDEV